MFLLEVTNLTMIRTRTTGRYELSGGRVADVCKLSRVSYYSSGKIAKPLRDARSLCLPDRTPTSSGASAGSDTRQPEQQAIILLEVLQIVVHV